MAALRQLCASSARAVRPAQASRRRVHDVAVRHRDGENHAKYPVSCHREHNGTLTPCRVLEGCPHDVGSLLFPKVKAQEVETRKSGADHACTDASNDRDDSAEVRDPDGDGHGYNNPADAVGEMCDEAGLLVAEYAC